MKKQDCDITCKRWTKKSKRVATLSRAVSDLQKRTAKDVMSKNAATAQTAVAVRVMLKTSERVGNATSAKNQHVGVTGLQKKNVIVTGPKIGLTYIGKSGVQQSKTVNDPSVVKYMKSVKKGELFPKTDRKKINKYLASDGVTSKDIRTFNANTLLVAELKKVKPIPLSKTERIRVFNACCRVVAGKVGNGLPTLKKHYIMPKFYTDFVEHLRISKI